MQSQTQSNSRAPRADGHAPERRQGLAVEALTAIASRHGFGLDAAQALWEAVVLGHGGMAQFSHPELGGSGQWLRGGMLMIGDMLNRALQARVSALCDEVARLYAEHPEWHRERTSLAAAGGEWWPQGLHTPSSSGAQNGIRYASFPGQQRLAIERAGTVELYDTGDHLIGGVSQQQGRSDSLAFASQHGPVDLASLRRVDEAGAGAASAATSAPPGERCPPSAPPVPRPSPAALAHAAADRSAVDLLDTIERLAGLRERGVLTEAEFTAKKTDLLGRL